MQPICSHQLVSIKEGKEPELTLNKNMVLALKEHISEHKSDMNAHQ